MAAAVKASRHATPPENPYREIEHATSEAIIASLNLYRDLRDAALEAMFFQIYGPLAVLGFVETAGAAGPAAADPRELPLIRDALATIGKGGYAEAIALIGALVGKSAGRITPARLELVDKFVRSDKVLSRLPPEDMRRIKSEQAVIAELEPERGLESLPKLLADPKDRRKALAVLDEAVAAVEFNTEQHAMLDRVRAMLGGKVRQLEEEWPDMAERELAETK
jgi:tellurite resistance protein